MTDAAVVDALANEPLFTLGQLPASSNGSLLVSVGREWTCDGDDTIAMSDLYSDDLMLAVYKPELGERPLWDFPPGLWRREFAAFRLSELLGWNLVPPTVVRDDVVAGVGSVQQFVNADFSQHYFSLIEAERFSDRLRQLAVFDLAANNTDRKAGHVLATKDEQLFAIDNGLCFSAEPKLRTVIWEFGGEPIEDTWRADLTRVADGFDEVRQEFEGMLGADDTLMLERRLRAVAVLDTLPNVPEDRRPYPWPLI
jgi:uncharacterized repeat protein (TIGR03843 family)